MSMVEKLACLKRRDKLTTDDIAILSGVPIGTLNKIFAGQTKNPALLTMDSICRVFNVPIRYVLDDSVPPDCSVTAYAEATGMFLVSPQEQALLQDYRILNPPEQRCTDSMIGQYLKRRPFQTGTTCERLIPCYEPIALAGTGFFTDTWQIYMLRVPVDSNTREADFAFVITTDRLSPIYQEGTVLAIRQWECPNHEVGLFLLNGVGYIRKLVKKRNEVRLVSIKTGDRDIRVGPRDDLRMLGTIKGKINTYEKFSLEDPY